MCWHLAAPILCIFVLWNHRIELEQVPNCSVGVAPIGAPQGKLRSFFPGDQNVAGVILREKNMS